MDQGLHQRCHHDCQPCQASECLEQMNLAVAQKLEAAVKAWLVLARELEKVTHLQEVLV